MTSHSRTKIVGILNITPDSFSDGGQFNSVDSALVQIEKMLAQGADIIDIGAQSTRPNAKIIGAQEEWRRLEPILQAIKNTSIDISIDTQNPAIVRKALEYNISYINDVSGFSDNEMVKAALDCNAKIVAMHHLTIPASPTEILPADCDHIAEIYKWGEAKIAQLIDLGFSKDRIIFDVGIGFGKSATQSFDIIKNIELYKQLGVAIYVGHSQKSFLTLFTDAPAGKRNIETAIISSFLAQKQVDYLRVHNVEETMRAIKIAQAYDE